MPNTDKNQYLALMLLAIWVAALTLFVVSREFGTRELVTARTLRIVNSEGGTIARLFSDTDGTHFALYDENSNERIGIAILPTKSALNFWNAVGDRRIAVYELPESAEVSLPGKADEGSLLLRVKNGTPGIGLTHPNGPAIAIQVGDPYASIELTSDHRAEEGASEVPAGGQSEQGANAIELSVFKGGIHTTGIQCDPKMDDN